MRLSLVHPVLSAVAVVAMGASGAVAQMLQAAPVGEYSPEWFLELAFADGGDEPLARTAEALFQRSWDGAEAMVQGNRLRAADQLTARAAVRLARAADSDLEGDAESAQAHLAGCVEWTSRAEALAEDGPQRMRASLLRARCHAVMPDRSAASAVLEKTGAELERPEGRAEFLYGAARLREDLGEHLAASELYRKAREVDPGGPLATEAALGAVETLLFAGRSQEALHLLAQVFELPAEEASVLRARGLLLLGDSSRAEQLFVEASRSADSVIAGQAWWRMGQMEARKAAKISFMHPVDSVRRADHARRRGHMDLAIERWHRAIATFSWPYTPWAIRDIGQLIEDYAQAVSLQLLQAASDTDRAALEIALRQRLPPIYRSAGAVYERQIRLARQTGDGMGVARQSARGLARTWWHAARAHRDAAVLLRASPRPAGSPEALARYEERIDSGARSQESHARAVAFRGLSELLVLDLGPMSEVDSLTSLLDSAGLHAARRIGEDRRDRLAQASVQPPTLTPLQWRWRELEARRLQRETLLDLRILRDRARLR